MGKPRSLLEHAAYELTKAGITSNEDPAARQVAVDTMALLRRFERQNHDESSGRWVLEFFNTLGNLLPLTPLTDDPEEWEKFEVTRTNTETGETEKSNAWISRRASSVVSEDGGKTWYDQRTGKRGEAVDHVKHAAEAKAREERREAIKNAKAAPNVLASPDTSVPAGEELPAAAPEKSKSQLKREAATKKFRKTQKKSK